MGIETIFENADIKTKLDELSKNKDKTLLLGINHDEGGFYLCCRLQRIVRNHEYPIIEVALTENGIPYGRNTKVRTYLLEHVASAYLLPGLK